MSRSLAALLVVLVGCASADEVTSTTGAADAAPAETARWARHDAAASAYAARWCAAYRKCRPLEAELHLGDTPSCIERVTLIMKREWFGPGSPLAVPAAAEACLAAIDLSTCAGWEAVQYGFRPPACAKTGSLADGVACARGERCESGACTLTGAERCGTCGHVSPDDGPCKTDADCAPARACKQGACKPLGGPGAPCTSITECDFDLCCRAGVCGPTVSEGEPCDPDIVNCAPYPTQLTCNRETRVCEKLTVVPIGAACGAIAGGHWALCERGSWCIFTTPGVPPTGTCQKASADGEGCSASPCEFAARCYGGVCQIVDVATCGGLPP